MVIGRVLGEFERGFSVLWSVGEVAVAAKRREDYGVDVHRDAVLDDVERRGFYVPLDSRAIELELSHVDGRDAWITGKNPYARLGAPADDRVLAHFRPGRSRGKRSRQLVLVCHCYGVPSPNAMSQLFGLDALHAQGIDVCTNIMGSHQPGTYPAWPGSGFNSMRFSRVFENLRASVTGARALAIWLRDRFDYESVTVIGFSLGGQLALHLSNAAPIDRTVAYCPVTSVRETTGELGLMPWMKSHVDGVMRRIDPGYSLDLLGLADPLAQELAIDPRDLHVIVQRHDVLATPKQIEAIRTRHPESRFYELGGTHLFPVGLSKIHGIVHDVVHRRRAT